jgi:hypothetical protein
MALVLALDGRGFAALGTRGLRVTQVVTATNEQKASLLRQAEINQ